MEVIRIPVGMIDTNCYLAFDDNKTGVIIDPGGNAPRILDAVQKNGLHILHVLLTHVHFDHVLAAEEVLRVTGADFLVPYEDEGALTNPARSLMQFAGKSNILLPKANRVLNDGDTVAAGGLNIQVLHTPGHTPGSSCFVCERTLFSGDTLFADGVGRTDFPGGDEEAIAQSAKRLSALEGDYTVLPGHGPETTLSAERRQNPYMQGNL